MRSIFTAVIQCYPMCSTSLTTRAGCLKARNDKMNQHSRRSRPLSNDGDSTSASTTNEDSVVYGPSQSVREGKAIIICDGDDCCNDNNDENNHACINSQGIEHLKQLPCIKSIDSEMSIKGESVRSDGSDDDERIIKSKRKRNWTYQRKDKSKAVVQSEPMDVVERRIGKEITKTTMMMMHEIYDDNAILGTLSIGKEARIIIQHIAKKYWKIAEENEIKEISMRSDKTQVFCGRTIPKISLGDYITRLVVLLSWTFNKSEILVNFESSGMRSLMLCDVYMERLMEMNKDLEIVKLNVHRLVLMTMLAGIGFTEDLIPKQHVFASIGGVSEHQICILERRLCKAINFRFWVTRDQYLEHFQNLLQAADISSNVYQDILQSSTWMG